MIYNPIRAQLYNNRKAALTAGYFDAEGKFKPFSSVVLERSTEYIIPKDFGGRIVLLGLAGDGYLLGNTEWFRDSDGMNPVWQHTSPVPVDWSGPDIIEQGFLDCSREDFGYDKIVLGVTAIKKMVLPTYNIVTPIMWEGVPEQMNVAYCEVKRGIGRQAFHNRVKTIFQPREYNNKLPWENCSWDLSAVLVFDDTPRVEHLHLTQISNDISLESPCAVDEAFQVTADGSTASKFRITFSSEREAAKNWLLQIKGPEALQKYYGSFEPLERASGNTISIKYKHPDLLYTDNQHNDLTMQLVESSTNLVRLEMPLRAYRPPVVLVHGLMSSERTFSKMKADLQSMYRSTFVKTVNYDETSLYPFNWNYPIISQEITMLVNQGLEEGISIGRVDYVGHSMGGILGRLHVQSAAYQNNIGKLITLNTPHAGSQWANAILGPEMNSRGSELCGDIPSDILAVLCRNSGALDDLRVDSPAILENLNGPSLRRHPVYAHAIITTFPFEPSMIVGTFQLIVTNEIMPYLFEGNLLPSTLFHEANDVVVSVSSQKGGLDIDCITPLTNITHSSTNDDDVIATVRYLLNSDKNNGSFCSYFNPPRLTYNPPPKLSPDVTTLRSLSEDLKITKPIAGQSFTSSSSIEIQYSTSSNVTDVKAIIDYSPDTMLVATISDKSRSITLQDDAKHIGRRRLVLLGKLSTGRWVADTSYFFLQQGGLPVALASFDIEVSESVNLSWSTLTETNAQSFEIQRSIDAKSFGVVGSIEARGNSKNKSTYEFSDTRPVAGTAYYRMKQIDSDQSYTYSRILPARWIPKIVLAPNPTRNSIQISSALIDGMAKVFSVKGQLIREKAIEQSSETIYLGMTPPGIYIVELSNSIGEIIVKERIIVMK